MVTFLSCLGAYRNTTGIYCCAWRHQLHPLPHLLLLHCQCLKHHLKRVQTHPLEEALEGVEKIDELVHGATAKLLLEVERWNQVNNFVWVIILLVVLFKIPPTEIIRCRAGGKKCARWVLYCFHIDALILLTIRNCPFLLIFCCIYSKVFNNYSGNPFCYSAITKFLTEKVYFLCYTTLKIYSRLVHSYW